MIGRSAWALALFALIGAPLLSAPPAAATEVEAATPDVAPRMMHPHRGYKMVIAYFEEHQTDVDMNMDASNAITIAADAAKTEHVSLVVTCHGEDAFAGGTNLSPDELAAGRLDTIRQGLIDRGVDAQAIVTDWGDKKLDAAAAKLQGPMQSDRPTCDMETAVPFEAPAKHPPAKPHG